MDEVPDGNPALQSPQAYFFMRRIPRQVECAHAVEVGVAFTHQGESMPYPQPHP